MPKPRLGALMAFHLRDAVTEFKRGSESRRAAAALAKIEPVAGVDPDALQTLASVTDTNTTGVERMEAEVRRQLSPEIESQP